TNSTTKFSLTHLLQLRSTLFPYTTLFRSNSIKSDAQVIIARSAMKTNNEPKAKTAYAEVQKIATGQLAAEALYYDAYFKNKEGKDRKSTRLNSSHVKISYAVFCLKKKIT